MKAYQNCTLPVIPLEERVKSRDLAICKGGCNRIMQIAQTKYQLCSTCSQKHRYVGMVCDIPNCDKQPIHTTDNKFLCKNCHMVWRNLEFCNWDRLVEQRRLQAARPETFVNALAAGLVTPVENPLKRVNGKFPIAKCSNCHEERRIDNSLYQICNKCIRHLQHYGEKCSLKGAEPCQNDAVSFNREESRYVCSSCQNRKNTYKIASYQMYESQIRSQTKCKFCGTEVSHNSPEGKAHCSAHIDHDHDTGKIRGVLCQKCNTDEGVIKAWAERIKDTPLGLIERIEDYYQSPALSESWIQKS